MGPFEFRLTRRGLTKEGPSTTAVSAAERARYMGRVERGLFTMNALLASPLQEPLQLLGRFGPAHSQKDNFHI